MNDTDIVTQGPAVATRIKVPVVLAERTIQIVVESDIPLKPCQQLKLKE